MNSWNGFLVQNRQEIDTKKEKNNGSLLSTTLKVQDIKKPSVLTILARNMDIYFDIEWQSKKIKDF